MNYFVTGATGFIGRFLVARLLEREEAQVYVLIRRSSAAKFAALEALFPERLHAVWGDVTEPGLTAAADRNRLAGSINHVFHLAAVYDLEMDDETGDRVNVGGTRNVVRFASEIGSPLQYM